MASNWTSKQLQLADWSFVPEEKGSYGCLSGLPSTHVVSPVMMGTEVLSSSAPHNLGSYSYHQTEDLYRSSRASALPSPKLITFNVLTVAYSKRRAASC